MTAPKKVIEAVKRIQDGTSRFLPGTVVVTGAQSRVPRTLHWSDPRTLTVPGSDQFAHFDDGPHPFDLDPIRRRTPQERVESLTRRLVGFYRGSARIPDDVMRLIRKEYWKAGMPVTEQDLRRTAQRILEVEERRQRRSLQRDVVTGAVSAPRPGATPFENASYEANE